MQGAIVTRFGTAALLFWLLAGALHCGNVENQDAVASIPDARQSDAQDAAAPAVDARSEPEPVPPKDFGDAPQHHAAAWCERLAGCAPGEFLLGYESVEHCQRVIARQWDLHSNLLGTTLTRESLEACALALQSLDCLDWRQGILPEPCRPRGELAARAPCVSDWQCPEGGYCAFNTSRFCIGGVCPLAQACGGTCSEQSNRTCHLGDGCRRDEAVCCVRGLSCVEGSCRVPAGDGQACSPTVACDTSQLLTCVDGICRPMTTAGPGEACDADRPCHGGYYCAGVCTAYVPEGGPCPGREVCEFPARCTGGVCKIADPPACPG